MSHDQLSDAQLSAQYLAASDAGHYDLADHLGALLDERGERLEALERHRLENAQALHASARFYAARGLPVFPLWPEAKTPLTSNGFKDASCDPVVIDTWWTRQPQANIGAPTGVLFDVLDIDGLAGNLSLTEFLSTGENLPPILGRARTARPGGWHYLVPVGSLGPRNRANLLPSVDVRADGGYVVAPPSRVNGSRYRWVDVPSFLQPKASA